MLHLAAARNRPVVVGMVVVSIAFRALTKADLDRLEGRVQVRWEPKVEGGRLST